MVLTFTMGKQLPQDISQDLLLVVMCHLVLALPMSTDRKEEWMEIGGLPNKVALARLQACLNPSVSKQGKHNPRAYQAALWDQRAKIVSRRQEHKDGT